jgi:predicted RNA-binding Zn-ribbon protein involved in translation (DUF1610 family)
MSQNEFPCEQCGANLQFEPGTLSLTCQYCGHDNPIVEEGEEELIIEEHDFESMLAELETQAPSNNVHSVKCTSCGAASTFKKNVVSDECPFCGSDIVTTEQTERLILPKSLIPFFVTKNEAEDEFKEWIQGLWFAPNALKERNRRDEKLQGVYVPYWTYDTATQTAYRGQRGTHYWVTKTVNGKSQQVRKTRWRSVSGVVPMRFNDVLVSASHSLPDKQADKLEPWKLSALVSYKDDYLSGFRAESYQINLPNGFGKAKKIMSPQIDQAIRGTIGGDEQRISSKNTQYADITFKHILLPIWISAYKYNEKIFRFLVNGQSGEVQGERPYSVVKIALATIAGLIVAGGIGFLIYLKSQTG